jgi:hypothetical protein
VQTPSFAPVLQPTDQAPPCKAAFTGRLRFLFHYTPTSCSWLNAVEGFFAKLTRRRLKRGVFRSIVELQAAINGFFAETNDNPDPSPGLPIPTRNHRRRQARAPSDRHDPLAAHHQDCLFTANIRGAPAFRLGSREKMPDLWFETG